MRKKLVRILSLIVVGCLSMPAWAQAPMVQPLPEPTPLGNPTESPPPPTIQARSIEHMGCADNCGGTPQGYWTAGGGIYYMQPFFGNNPAFAIGTGAGTAATKSSQSNFSQRLNVAPLAFVGYTFASGWGIRGRWFQYSSDGRASATIDPAATTASIILPTGAGNPIGGGSTISASSNLKLSVYDLEGTYIFGNERFCVLMSAGARYASFSQSYQLNINDPTGVATGAFSAYHNFTGVGPTMSVEVRKQICDSCFALFANARGSILFGSGGVNSSASFTDVDLGPVTSSGSAHQTLVLPIGEIEMGGEVAVSWGRFRIFGQLGVVGQVWWGAGNASQGLDLSIGSGAVNGNNNNFGLIGAVARAGVNF